jgi:hypothetical protein
MQKRHTATAIAAVSPRSDRAMAFQENDWRQTGLTGRCHLMIAIADRLPPKTRRRCPWNEFDG